MQLRAEDRGRKRKMQKRKQGAGEGREGEEEGLGVCGVWCVGGVGGVGGGCHAHSCGGVCAGECDAKRRRSEKGVCGAGGRGVTLTSELKGEEGEGVPAAGAAQDRASCSKET
jgi:hypothetical protein